MTDKKDNNDHRLIDLKSRRQQPQTLFISCSDCHIDTAFIASIHPGEFYLIQNVGNFIPPYHPNQDYSETAAIEFALTYLTISDIIICGHRHCAVMKACQSGHHDNTPVQLDRWIAQIRSQIPFHDQASIDDISHRHLLNQIENIKKYPIVRDKLENNSVKIHAWHYDAEQKTLHQWNPKTHQFQLIEQAELFSQ
jgi:carbonic anhydrase